MGTGWAQTKIIDSS